MNQSFLHLCLILSFVPRFEDECSRALGNLVKTIKCLVVYLGVETELLASFCFLVFVGFV